MFVMRKLIFLLSALLLCAGCDKNEGEPLDMAEQNRINNQFLGLWQEVDHPSSQCTYRGFHSNFPSVPRRIQTNQAPKGAWSINDKTVLHSIPLVSIFRITHPRFRIGSNIPRI